MNKTLKYALVQTSPIMVGFVFIGAAFGLLLADAGYGRLWAMGMALIVYGGSLQFALLPLIASHASLVTVAIMSVSICSRQMVYGLSLIERFKAMGRKQLYMIYSLCDETYSVLCSEIPEDIDRQKFDFYCAVLDMIYWTTGCTLGNIFGSLITFNTNGVDFAMTALFVVICVEQWLGAKNHMPALIGGGCGVICLVIFGAGNFILPALLSGIAVMLLMKNKIREGE